MIHARPPIDRPGGAVMPRALDDGAVLYATPSRDYRMLLLILLGILLLLALIATAVEALLLTAIARGFDGPVRTALLVTVAVMVLLTASLIVSAILMMVMWTRLGFVVTTEGLTLSPHLRARRHVPWADVAAIETGSHGMLSGAVVVVRRDGEHITDSTTTWSSARSFSRAPSYLPRETAHVSPPQRVARDALERHRRGEFAAGRLPVGGYPWA